MRRVANRTFVPRALSSLPDPIFIFRIFSTSTFRIRVSTVRALVSRLLFLPVSKSSRILAARAPARDFYSGIDLSYYLCLTYNRHPVSPFPPTSSPQSFPPTRCFCRTHRTSKKGKYTSRQSAVPRVSVSLDGNVNARCCAALHRAAPRCTVTATRAYGCTR